MSVDFQRPTRYYIPQHTSLHAITLFEVCAVGNPIRLLLLIVQGLYPVISSDSESANCFYVYLRLNTEVFSSTFGRKTGKALL
jgi:hypothetical protein